jgi:hypothetical protein
MEMDLRQALLASVPDRRQVRPGRFVLRISGALLALAFLMAALVSPTIAFGEAPVFWEKCPTGPAAGQCNIPRGVATAPASAPNAGHVFVADQANRRIDEFDAWGQFVKAWGWDDVNSGPGDSNANEVQNVTVKATAGTFTLTFGGQTTAPIAFNASGSQVAAAINALSSVGGAGGSVSVSGGPGSETGTAPYAITFGGVLGGDNVAQLTSTAAGLSGGNPSSSATVATVTNGGAFEICLPANDVCKAGVAVTPAGTGGAGAFNSPQGVAIDSAGNIYVLESGGRRVQKFSPAAQFLRMFGGGVNTGTSGNPNICTNAGPPTNVCKEGTAGTANGQFGAIQGQGSYLAIETFGTPTAADDKVYAGDVGRIQRFNDQGEWQANIPLPGESVDSLAVDTSGSLYATYIEASNNNKPNARKLDPVTGAELCAFEASNPRGLAVAPNGDVYVFNKASGGASQILRFSPACASPPGLSAPVEAFGSGLGENAVGLGIGAACLSAGVNVYFANGFGADPSFVRAYGPPPNKTALCPPPKAAPVIQSQFATSVETDGAVLQAEINPKFWADTRYFVEYGTSDCSLSPCDHRAPLTDLLLNSGAVDVPVLTAKISITGLQPATTYFYRFVAESSGGGPVRGVGGQSASFTTTPIGTPVRDDCPNQGFRTGPSAYLPDCRAYELVSPLDKAGGSIQARLNLVPTPASDDQADDIGAAFTYSAYRSFANAQSAPFSSQYLARRDPQSGWVSEALSPPQEGEAFVSTLRQVDNLFRAFSPSLDEGWLYTDTEPVLAPGGVAGHPNLYRRDSATGTYRACTTKEPQLSESQTQLPQLQGFTADHSAAVFRQENKLTDDATDVIGGKGVPVYQLYICSFANGGNGGADLRLVSILPDGTPSKGENTAGGPANDFYAADQGRTETLSNAVSADGTRVFWTAGSDVDGQSPAPLYVRLNPTQPQSALSGGECTEPAKACTLEISGAPARYWTAARSGSVAIFSVGGQLSEYDVETRETRPIADQFKGLLGASQDASQVYFLSGEVLGDGAAEGALGGKPNLYRYEASGGPGPGTYTYVATLSTDDAKQGASDPPSPVSPEPNRHTARVTEDGGTLVFMSNSASLSQGVAEYDNTDQANGKPDAEVYRYDASSSQVECISCNPTGARPLGGEVKGTHFPNEKGLPAAASLPTWESALYAPRAVSANGGRVFFESFEALTLADTNGRTDVYEWEQPGTGDCDASASTYVVASGGCVSLISSGKSANDSQFVDADEDGSNVFIRTSSGLVGYDPGDIDIYDARVGGGLPAPPPTAVECDGQACQNPAAAPGFLAPSSSIYHGAGNVRKSAPKHCRRSRQKGRKVRKARCHRKHHHRRTAGHGRRAAR